MEVQSKSLLIRVGEIVQTFGDQWRQTRMRISASTARMVDTAAERGSALWAPVEPYLKRAFGALDGRLRAIRATMGPPLERAWTGLDERTGGRLSNAMDTLRGNTIVQLGTAVALAVAVLAGLDYAGNQSTTSVGEISLYEVTRGPIDIRITERGDLRALDSVTMSAQDDVPLIHIIAEGTQVAEGDLLVRFDASKREAELAEAESAHQVALADQNRAEEELEAQRDRLLAEIAGYERDVKLAELALVELSKKPLPADLATASLELERAQVAFQNAKAKRESLPPLVDKGFITKETMEEAELGYYEAQAANQAAQFAYEKVSAGATAQEKQLAGLTMQTAEFALERARSGMESQLDSYAAGITREKANVTRANSLIKKAKFKLETTTIHAPRDGLVVYATIEGSNEKPQLGMIPFEGQPLIYLPDLTNMVVDTEVNEIDIGKVTIGGPVAIRLEAYPGAVFEGKVLKIGSLAKLKRSARSNDSGVKVFDVTVKVDGTDPRLKPGLTAVAEFVVDHADEVVAVPLSAVASRGGNHRVQVAGPGGIVEREVSLGASNDELVIVESGLDAGDKVVIGARSPRR